MSLEKIIKARLKEHRQNLRGWDSGGHLRPSEPDVKERARIMYELGVVVEELEAILTEAGYDVE